MRWGGGGNRIPALYTHASGEGRFGKLMTILRLHTKECMKYCVIRHARTYGNCTKKNRRLIIKWRKTPYQTIFFVQVFFENYW